MNLRQHLAAYSAAILCAVFGAACEGILGLNKLSYYDDGTGGTGGAGGATIPPGCIPSEAGGPVDDSCGVFVSSSKGNDDTATLNSKGAAFATIGKAIAAAKGQPIYLCAETFTEAIALTDDVTVYGGLDCSNGWAYVGPDTKSTWTAGADAIPLHVVTGARATIEDVAMVAADATVPSGSSIAVLAEVGTQVSLTRCDVSAGNGAKGAEGETPSGTGTPGMSGGAGTDACTAAGLFADPGIGGALMCDSTNVRGGDGGTGTTDPTTGGDGSDGKPTGVDGIGGIGQDEKNLGCTPDYKGGDGTAGDVGESGSGAPMDLGSIDVSGYTGPAGDTGKPGLPGQGGGGGGGGRVCANGKAGPSGGGGGSGGCGGLGGNGGKSGGGSIGIVSLGAKLTLDTVSIITKAGGEGGNGGAGQPGGPGGAGGMPGMKEPTGNPPGEACSGGKGGDGGTGGKGGGGRGGPSIGIAYTGDGPNENVTTYSIGAPGDGGLGKGPDGTGATGATAEKQAF